MLTNNRPWSFPYAAGILSVLYIYVVNLRNIAFESLFLPLAFTVSLIALIRLAMRLLPLESHKRDLLLSYLVILFFSYGHAYTALQRSFGIGLGRHRFLIPLWVALFAVSFWAVVKEKPHRDYNRTLVRSFLFSLVLLVCFNLVQTLRRIGESPSARAAAAELPALQLPAAKPDVYYIIMDEFASPAQARELFGYDNTPFIRSLEQKGFFVAGESRSRYLNTDASLAASLNMEPLRPGDDLFRKIRENKVARLLKAQGYAYYHFGSWFSHTSYSNIADVNFNSFIFRNEFNFILMRSTACRTFMDYFLGSSQSSVRQTLEALGKVAAQPSPKFVFAHLICPHSPFVFGRNGEKVPLKDAVDPAKAKQLYLDQYIFMSKQAEALVDRILKSSPREPVIILQSDHGLRGMGGDAHRVLNAYHFPGGAPAGLTRTVSPIDSFRVLFNRYFGASLALVGDEP